MLTTIPKKLESYPVSPVKPRSISNWGPSVVHGHLVNEEFLGKLHGRHVLGGIWEEFPKSEPLLTSSRILEGWVQEDSHSLGTI